MVLIVDNGSKYITHLEQLCRPYHPVTVSLDRLVDVRLDSYSLIILSGGHQAEVQEHPEFYQREIALVRSAAVPVLGVCLGFEIMAYAFGSRLKQLTASERGVVTLETMQPDPIFDRRTYTVMENHRWVVSDIGHELIPLARSIDGVEIIRHRSRPMYGFQFHPEAPTAGKDGRELLTRAVAVLQTGR